MTTIANIKWGKDQFNEHVERHRCRALLDLREGDTECARRRSLWLEYMSIAEQWGVEDSAGDTPAYR
jgi:hypothetical protein